MFNLYIQIVCFLFVSISQVSAESFYKDEMCMNQYLMKQYDVAFAACNAASKTKPSYVNLLNIGSMYLNGWGVKRNTALAMKYFKRAILQNGGDGTAEHNLAYAYSEGIGVERNLSKAIALCRKAAKSGHEGSQFNLSLSYFNGDGVQVNYIDGYAWLIIASKYENTEALELLVKVRSQLSKADKLLGEKKAVEILNSLPKSRKMRIREIKSDLINTINRN